jgi:hypothetical protein
MLAGTAPVDSGLGSDPGEYRRAVASTARWSSGPAPVTPLTPSIGRPLKLPTHTATVKLPAAATAQLSVKWRLVPVLGRHREGKIVNKSIRTGGPAAGLTYIATCHTPVSPDRPHN